MKDETVSKVTKRLKGNMIKLISKYPPGSDELDWFATIALMCQDPDKRLANEALLSAVVDQALQIEELKIQVSNLASVIVSIGEKDVKS